MSWPVIGIIYQLLTISAFFSSSTFSGGYTVVIKPSPGIDLAKEPGFLVL
jgi:hypothetical protein